MSRWRAKFEALFSMFLKIDDPICSATGGHWNPYQVNMADYPGPGSGTDDQYEVKALMQLLVQEL